MPTSEWKLPLNIAIGFHILIVIGAIYLPGLFAAKPKFADIYTVSLINIAEPAVTPPPVETAEKSSPPIIKKKAKSKKIAPIAPVAKIKKVTATPIKAISLKPLKRKKIKKKKRVDNSLRLKEIERRKRQQLARALKEEELLAENAKIAQQALENELNLLKPVKRSLAKIKQPSSQRQNGATISGMASSTSLISSRYNSAIASRLLQFWSLPEFMQKKGDLTAIVGITIRKNGAIANIMFERRSGNRVFDQFVHKAIEAANPLPPIPAAMKKQRYEIGLIYKPGSIK